MAARAALDGPKRRAPSRAVDRSTEAATLQSALDALDHGVLVVAGDGRLVSSNARGHAFLRQATHLRLLHGRLEAGDAAGPVFEAALRRVLTTGRPESCPLDEDHDATAPVATISRLPVASGDDCALVLVTAPGRQRVATVRQLIQVYRLTPAEGRLAHAFLSGHTLGTFELSEGIRTSTARTHMRALLRKTGTNRQVDLMRLLAALPSARAG